MARRSSAPAKTARSTCGARSMVRPTPKLHRRPSLAFSRLLSPSLASPHQLSLAAGGQRNNGPDDVDGSPVRTFRRNSVLSKTTNEGYEWFRVESASSGGGESEGSGSSSTSCICTTATFAPIPAVAALEEAYGGEFYDPQALPPQPEDDEPSSGRAILSLDEWSSERAKATRVRPISCFPRRIHVVWCSWCFFLPKSRCNSLCISSFRFSWSVTTMASCMCLLVDRTRTCCSLFAVWP
eukprot:scaffold1311_cov256-Pinguiococcus_pyrenoidosus.AAC.65